MRIASRAALRTSVAAGLALCGVLGGARAASSSPNPEPISAAGVATTAAEADRHVSPDLAGSAQPAAPRAAGGAPAGGGTASAGSKVDEVALRASDGHGFKADYYSPASAAGAPAGVLLIPDLAQSRKSLEPLASRLRTLGYHVLAMDNSGQMRNVAPSAGLQKFTPYDSKILTKMILDVEPAVTELLKRTRTSGGLVIVGFGIGANLALQYGAENESIGSIAMVMPGYGCDQVDPYDALALLRSRPALLIETKKRHGSDLSRAFHEVSERHKDFPREQLILARAPSPTAGEEPALPDDEVQGKLLDWLARTLPLPGE